MTVRLPVVAFVVLALATVGAFFVTQHLKVTTPLIAGFPAPVPNTINPVNGGTCPIRNPEGRKVPVSFRRTRVSFYLLNRADVVNVYMVDNATQAVVRTLPGSGSYMRVKHRRAFTWNGRKDNGAVAPDGSYDIRVALVHQGRNVTISNQNTGAIEPVTVQTRPPRLEVTSITPDVIAVPGHSTVTIHYTGNQGLRPRVEIFGSGARLLKSFAATQRNGTSRWNGTLRDGRPAPPGTYLIGLKLSPDRTCNTVRSATTPAAAPHAAVVVR